VNKDEYIILLMLQRGITQ